MRRRAVILARLAMGASAVLLSVQAHATPAGSLGTLVADFANDPSPLASISTLEGRFNSDPSFGLVLNSDNGVIYYTGISQGGGLTPAQGVVPGNTVSNILVSQPNGPSVRVFDFSGFTLTPGFRLSVVGSLPAAVISQGDITVNGPISVSAGSAGGGAGGGSPSGHDGAPGASAGGTATGGGGGQQDLGLHPSVTNPCCFFGISAGGGGGGGYILPGQAGHGGTSGDVYTSGGPGVPGSTTAVLQAQGGAGGQGTGAPPAVLRGGTGGGGGGDNQNDQINGYAPGQAGGAGGGAVLFATAGNMTIGASGSISADGVSPGGFNSGNGAGGGGSGGALWFDPAGAFVNHGLISAQGGAGGTNTFNTPGPFQGDGFGGAGAGGVVLIDPQSISNFGTIDVADGNGLSLNGGFVGATAPEIFLGNVVGEAALPEPPLGLPLLAAGLVLLASRKARSVPGTRR